MNRSVDMIPEVSGALLKLVEEGTDIDKCAAIEALASLREVSAVAVLERRLTDDDIDVCIAAADALGTLGSADSVPLLISSLVQDPEAEVKIACTEALGKIGGGKAISLLQQLVRQSPENLAVDESDPWDDYWDIQLKAVQALGKLGVDTAVPVLLELLCDEQAQDIEHSLLKALVDCGETGVSAVCQYIQSGSVRSRRRAIKVLASVTSQRAVEQLYQALLDESSDVRQLAAEGLGGQETGSHINVLLPMLRDPVEQVRAAALNSLCANMLANSDQSVPYEQIIALLVDSHARVRITALSILRDLAAQGRIPLTSTLRQKACQCVQSENSAEAMMACEFLGYFSQPEIYASLRAILHDLDKDPQLRRQALLGLSGYASSHYSEVLTLLRNAIKDSQQPVRLAALHGLRSIYLTVSDPLAEETVTPLHILLSAFCGEPLEQHTTTVESVSETDSIHAVVEDASEPVNHSDDLIESLDITDQMSEAELSPIPADYQQSHPESRSDYQRTAASSTLEAIALDNVEATLLAEQQGSNQSRHVVEMLEELPEQYQQYAPIIQHNYAMAKKAFIPSGDQSEIALDIRCLSARLLADIPDPLVAQTLIASLSDEHASIRLEAISALALFAEQYPDTEQLDQALGALITQLQTGDAGLRQAAARALGLLQHRAAMEPLVDAMEDGNAEVRIAAVRALARLTQSPPYIEETSVQMVISEPDRAEIIYKLRHVLKDKQHGVRNAVIEALAVMQAWELMDEVIQAAVADGGTLACNLGRLLRQYPRSICLTSLLKALERGDSSALRRVVIQMLQEILPEKSDIKIAA